MIHYFDRSRTETDHKCPRRLYWEYYWDGKGLQPVKLNQHLAFGGAVHEAIAEVLALCKMNDELPSMVVIVNDIIPHAQRTLHDAFTQAKGFQTTEVATEIDFEGNVIQVSEDQGWLVDHYCDLLEGLVVGWSLVRLPELLQQYKVIEVETEEQLHMPVVDPYYMDGNQQYQNIELVFNSRPDAILERRTDGALVILSLKTTSQVNQMWLENFKTDQQTVSEVLPVEARLGREVAGVQVEGLVKGAMKYDWPVGSDSNYHHNSPVIWGYNKEAGGFENEWKAQYSWKDEFGKGHRLGKGWNRRKIAESYPGGIPEWVGYIYQNEPELLRAQFPSPPLISRSAGELEEWLEQVKYREVEVHNALVEIKQRAAVENILAQHFPKHTSGCAYDPQYHSKCPCYGLCWGSESQDPLGCGTYKYREPNHPEEFKQ